MYVLSFTIPGSSAADPFSVLSAACFFLTRACHSSACVGKERIEMGVSAFLLASRSLKIAARIDVASALGTNFKFAVIAQQVNAVDCQLLTQRLLTVGFIV